MCDIVSESPHSSYPSLSLHLIHQSRGVATCCFPDIRHSSTPLSPPTWCSYGLNCPFPTPARFEIQAKLCMDPCALPPCQWNPPPLSAPPHTLFSTLDAWIFPLSTCPCTLWHVSLLDVAAAPYSPHTCTPAQGRAHGVS